MPRSLYTTFGVRKILRPVDHSLQTKGISRTFKKIIKKVSRDFIIDLPEDTKKVLKKDRVLVICNHPFQADVLLLLAALPQRSDTYLVIMHHLLSVLPSIDKHLIPVYISHRVNSHSKSDWKLNLLKKIHFSPDYSKETAHQKNVQNIVLATQKIDQGHLLCLFPAGGTENRRDFLPGVGHIINNLQKPKRTKLVMAHVSGTSAWDFFRLIPLINRFLPRFKINFSKVFTASEFSLADPKNTAKNLQGFYDRWSEQFKPLPKFQHAALYLRSFLLFLIFQG